MELTAQAGALAASARGVPFGCLLHHHNPRRLQMYQDAEYSGTQVRGIERIHQRGIRPAIRPVIGESMTDDLSGIPVIERA